MQIPKKLHKEVAMHTACGKSVHKFYCTECRCTISCGHMGEEAIRRHVTGKRHTEKTEEADRAILQPSLNIPRAHSALQDKVKNTVLV